METFFTYFIKVSVLVSLFYLSYYFLLKKETFFSKSRWFLLAGLITSIVLPLVTITKTIWIEPEPVVFREPVFIPDFPHEVTVNHIPETQTEINWSQLVAGFYLMGALFFLVKFVLSSLSLYKILHKAPIIKHGGYKFIDSKNVKTPFSFFNYIAFDSSSFSSEELQSIITHEKVYSRQKHSVDVLLSELFSIILWFHPFVWLYKKVMLQNLEFIADSKAIKVIENKINYQKTLLKITLQPQDLALVNPFFQPFIKKRIMMLNKNQSRKSQLWKYAVVLPVLMLFVMQFQTKVVAQTKKSQPTSSIKEKTNQILIMPDTIVWVKDFAKSYEKADEWTKDFKKGCNSTDKNEKHIVKGGSWEDVKKHLEKNLPEQKKKPMVIINGKEIPKEKTDGFWNLEEEVTIVVYNEKEAVEKFGERGKDGVMVIEEKVKNSIFRTTNEKELISFLKAAKDYKQIDIFDRFGKLVYSLKSGEKLEEEKINSFGDGTYFYVLEKTSEEKVSGYLYKGDTATDSKQGQRIKEIQKRAKEVEIRAKEIEEKVNSPEFQKRIEEVEARAKEVEKRIEERNAKLEERKKEMKERRIVLKDEKASFSTIINKNTTDQEIKEYISQFKSNQNIEMKASNIKRNKNGEIYKIKISLSENSDTKGSKKESKTESTFERNSNEAIPEIFIGRRNGTLYISGVSR